MEHQPNEETRYLIIEFSFVARKTLQNSLLSIGIRVDNITCCDTLQNADIILEESSDIDFIIIGWTFPDDRILTKNFLKELRKKEDFSETPILMIAMRGWQDDIIEAMESGVNGYLFKGFSKEDLKKKIEEVLLNINLGQKPFMHSANKKIKVLV